MDDNNRGAFIAMIGGAALTDDNNQEAFIAMTMLRISKYSSVFLINAHDF
jgi:hypothetical protein